METSKILRQIFADKKIEIEETNGRETIAEANDVFCWISDHFKKWGLDKSKPTPKTLVDIYEMVDNGTS